MIRNLVGILFLIVSGFFVYMVTLLSFFNFPDVELNKFLIIAGFCVPLAIFHIIGLALYRGANWKVSTGITFFVGASFNILVVFSIISIKASPELTETIDASSLSTISDYVTGFATMAIFAGLGTALYFNGKQTNKNRTKGSDSIVK